ncbi:MAG: stage II sporulation protein R [Mycoplasmatota bacterium]|nr:stage II sporulation protein R [Mycoplasmatota bacterium]
MKKLTVIIFIIITILCLNKQATVTVPREAIRFRIIANSNKEKDQYIKKQIVTNLNSTIKKIEFTPKDLSTSRQNIKQSIPEFSQVVEKTLKELNASEKYSINYGLNYFPEKEYKGIKYEAGEYESLVITLGDGLGENFWCILFPPLCLLEAEDENTTDIEYTSFIEEIINKYF